MKGEEQDEYVEVELTEEEALAQSVETSDQQSNVEEKDSTGNGASREGPDEEDDEEGDERLGTSEGDQEDGQDEGMDDERREHRRAQNRAKRIRNRRITQLREQQIDTLIQSNQQMREQIAQLQGRSVQYDISNLSTRLSQVRNDLNEANRTMAACVKAQDGDGVAEVSEIQYKLRDQEKQLQLMIQRAQQASRSEGGDREGSQNRHPDRQSSQQAVPRMSPEAKRLGSQWLQANRTWYRPGPGASEETLIAQAIDRAVADDEFDPATPEYWRELDRRIRERMPNVKTGIKSGSGSNGESPRRQSGPRMAATNNGGGNGRRVSVKVTPERRKAMEEAGYWDDPDKRAKMLKRYAEHDRQAALNKD